MILDSPCHEGNKETAELDTGHGDRHSERSPSQEPVVNHGHYRNPAAHTGAKRYGQVGHVEVPHLLYLGVEEEPDAHDEVADYDHSAGTETVN